MIVVESSAVVDALIGERANHELLTLVAAEELHAPSLLDYEVASALRGHALSGKLSRVRTEDAASDFAGLRIDRYALGPMLPEVLGLRENFTVHDAAYVVLARVLDCVLVTADRKLLEARRHGVEVRVLRPA